MCVVVFKCMYIWGSEGFAKYLQWGKFCALASQVMSVGSACFLEDFAQSLQLRGLESEQTLVPLGKKKNQNLASE